MDNIFKNTIEEINSLYNKLLLNDSILFNRMAIELIYEKMTFVINNLDNKSIYFNDNTIDQIMTMFKQLKELADEIDYIDVEIKQPILITT